ncbi:MAG: orotate phosphoribosyltransferase [Methylococcales bacterium]
MLDYQKEFIEFALSNNVLRFGSFTLKSGRVSPYFFNTGLFQTGAQLDLLGQFYARALNNSKLEFDVMYGPAYKGIPLVCATAIAYSRMYGKQVSYAFNRKETKDHGEGGDIVGTPLKGSILILDDVITAGTSIGESVGTIRSHNAEPTGVLISLDRKEKGEGNLTAVDEVSQKYAIPVTSIITIDTVVEYLETDSSCVIELKSVRNYRSQFSDCG